MPPKPTSPPLLGGRTVTLVREPLPGGLAPSRVLELLSAEPLPFALVGRWAGGGAIVGSSPLAVAAQDADPFAVLDDLPALREDLDDGLFQGELPGSGSAHGGPDAGLAVGGGWFGWLGYRLGARIERLPDGPPRPVPLPDFHLAFYDNLLRLDTSGRWWFEALVSAGRERAIAMRLAGARELLGTAPASAACRLAQAPGPDPLRLRRAGAAHHVDAVADCVRRIAAGEIFQANVCLRLESEWPGTAGELLSRALERFEPPYAAAFQTPHGQITSLSPELFLRRRGSQLTTGPIKGTIERSGDPVAAAAALGRLRSSAKDAAEHVMIVDLMRNDLGRVCAYGSIEAPRRPAAEPHPSLWHLVSYVHGRVRPGTGNADVLRATFPPGSVTGAPKVQALKVIARLERTGREAYTGAIGFVSPLAGLELSVAIRTLEMRAGQIWLGAGGGIVADSDPRLELEEALAKARPIAAAIGTSLLVGERAAEGSRRHGRRAA